MKNALSFSQSNWQNFNKQIIAKLHGFTWSLETPIKKWLIIGWLKYPIKQALKSFNHLLNSFFNVTGEKQTGLPILFLIRIYIYFKFLYLLSKQIKSPCQVSKRTSFSTVVTYIKWLSIRGISFCPCLYHTWYI